MARPQNYRHIFDNTLASFSSMAPSQQITRDGFPSGNELIKQINLRSKGTFTVVTPGGAPVVDGGMKILRSLTIESDKHGKIVDAMPGLELGRQLAFENGTKPINTDCASNASGTTFSVDLPIKFADEQRLIRPYDAALHMNNSRLTVKRQYGLVTDVQTAGTTVAVNPLREDCHVDVLPGPINDGSAAMNPGAGNPSDYDERPLYLPTRERIVQAVASTTKYRVSLPVGDRILRRIYISQQTIAAATGLQTEVSTIITENTGLSLKLGKDVLVDNITWGELQERNKLDADLDGTWPTGWAFIPFDNTKRISDMLDLFKYPSGLTFTLEFDGVTATDAAVVIGLDSLKLIPDAARG